MSNDKAERIAMMREAAQSSFDLINQYHEQFKALKLRIEFVCDNGEEEVAKDLIGKLAQNHLRLAIALLSMSLDDDVIIESELPEFLTRDFNH